uniref:Uncharacterized protein n=1 Tax=Arion vulgaris TaxID=1028688 RepID=A0A0B7BUB0_9EUPU
MHEKKNMRSVARELSQAILNAARGNIPRGARKDYKPYWTAEVQKLEKYLEMERSEAEQAQSVVTNTAYKAAAAKYRREVKRAARQSWVKTTESLNIDRDGHKLWKLAKAMSDDNTSRPPIVLEQDNFHPSH